MVWSILVLAALIIGNYEIDRCYGAKSSDFQVEVPFLTGNPPPLVLMVMGKNHRLFQEAYNDASDINGDGWIDYGYHGKNEPFADANGNGLFDQGESFSDINKDGKWNTGFDYYGYFDSYKCYEYDDSLSPARFVPVSVTANKKCRSSETEENKDKWSGDFLNYITMSRMDTLRKVLYGGYRVVDSETETVLERVFVPQDAHSWGKEYHSVERDGYNINDYAPLRLPDTDQDRYHLFGSTNYDTNLDKDGSNDPPLLLVLPNSTHRIWEWASKERAVLDYSLEDEMAGPAGTDTRVLTNHTDFEDFFGQFATSEHLLGVTTATSVFSGWDWLGWENPFRPYTTDDQNYYIVTFKAKIRVLPLTKWSNVYNDKFKLKFKADDAMEVIINGVTDTGVTINQIVYGKYGSGSAEIITDEFTLPNGTYEMVVRYHELTGDEFWSVVLERQYTSPTYPAGAWTVPGVLRYFTDAEIAANYWEYIGVNLLNQTYIDNNGNSQTTHDWVLNYYDLIDHSVLPTLVTKYETRVQVCLPGTDNNLLESNCQRYDNGQYKPIGLLQKFGEPDKIKFGLITGSYGRSTEGGMLRKNISSINDEINPDTGQIIRPDRDNIKLGSIIATIDELHIAKFNYSPLKDTYAPAEFAYSDCDRYVTDPTLDFKCMNWGNPIAEMMYEGLRYFSGKKAATSSFVSADTSDAQVPKLHQPDWLDPYQYEDLNYNNILDPGEDLNGNGKLDGFLGCSKPYLLVLSDINPTYDSDKVPGSRFNSFNGDLTGMDVGTLSNVILANEPDMSGKHFIGQSGGTTVDSACSAKDINDLGYIRGVCYEEPSKKGSYYSAAVSYYGMTHDISSLGEGDQNVKTMVVAVASPLPRINIAMADSTITLVPFAKSVYLQSKEVTAAPLWPGKVSSAIVDFYIEDLTPTHGKFRINYEDAEMGADYDMDDIVTYEYTVNADNTLTVSVMTGECSTWIPQHFGYVISGTTADGPYLEVRNKLFPESDPVTYPTLTAGYYWDIDYVLDTGVCDNPDYPCKVCTTCTVDGKMLPWGAVRTFTPSNNPAVTLLENPLYYAAKWGGFKDSNDNGVPDQQNEWDGDQDGLPDNYFYVVNPANLVEQLDKAFSEIESESISAAGVAVSTNSRSGEGAIYRVDFYSRYEDIDGNSIYWVGGVNALFIDANGNYREDSDGDHMLDVKETNPGEDADHDNIFDSNEDTNGNGFLDANRDLIIRFEEDGIYKIDDVNENQEVDENDVISGPVAESDIHFLWSANEWLNQTNLLATSQRVYNVNDNKRYIFTFIDQNNSGGASPDEQIPFSVPDTSEIPDDDLTDITKIYPYLTLYPTFNDRPVWANDLLSSGDKNLFLKAQSQRVVDYIRGEDQGAITVGTHTLKSMRSRQFRDGDGVLKTWRLGDIINSTPTQVGRPAEAAHLLYKDKTYAEFYDRYSRRRNVIYVGGNDGMLHAFNGGFFDSTNNAFRTTVNEPYYDTNGDGKYTAGEQFFDWDGSATWNTTTPHALGAELWAYVPFNLLSHLYWLTEADYGGSTREHISYMDMKPRIFDAKIFPANESDKIHPNGWGTVLVVGMRMGGSKIVADINRDNDSTDPDNSDKVMTSAFVVMDITDPERPPVILGEITVEDLGYTTCYPAVVPVKQRPYEADDNKWYLVFGSGPADANGDAATGTVLVNMESLQQGRMFAVDLKDLVDSYTLSQELNDYRLADNSYVSAPSAVDYGLDFATDVVYFGTVEGSSASGWSGKLMRLLVDENPEASGWSQNIFLDTSLLGLKQPITVQPNIGFGGRVKFDTSVPADGVADFTGFDIYDNDTGAANPDGEPDDISVRNRWVYFGTGLFNKRSDLENNEQQSFYGVKEPIAINQGFTWGTVNPADLLNSTDIMIDSDKTVYNYPTTGKISTWDQLRSDMELKPGWRINFESLKEKNTTKSLLFGEVVAFTTFDSESTACSLTGHGWIYALYYETGTAHPGSILGHSTERIVTVEKEEGGTEDKDIEIIDPKEPLGPNPPEPPALKEGEEDALIIGEKEVLVDPPGKPNNIGKTGWLQLKR